MRRKFEFGPLLEHILKTLRTTRLQELWQIALGIVFGLGFMADSGRHVLRGNAVRS